MLPGHVTQVVGQLHGVPGAAQQGHVLPGRHQVGQGLPVGMALHLHHSMEQRHNTHTRRSASPRHADQAGCASLTCP